MHEFGPGEWGEELSRQEREAVDKLGAEYRNHMRRREGLTVRRRPIEEVTKDFRDVLAWLMIDDIESVNDKNIKSSEELYFEYTAYDIEDTFFIVYEELNGRRPVRLEDIIAEHKETNLKDWQTRQTKEAADFLIIHGANENEINEWKGVEGSARQQRAMRRMYWLLQQPYMSQFKGFLQNRASKENPYNFLDLAQTVKGILTEGYQNLSDEINDPDRETLAPRIREDQEQTENWLKRALNICENVFDKDIDQKIYITKYKNGK